MNRFYYYNACSRPLKKINPGVPIAAQSETIKEIQRIASPELLANKDLSPLVNRSIPVSKRVDGDNRGDHVWLIDFKNPYNNEFVVSNQFTVIENGNNKRPDVILFVNGIPLLLMEWPGNRQTVSRSIAFGKSVTNADPRDVEQRNLD